MEGKKGRLPWPVNGTLVRPFGNIVDPKYGTATKNAGWDIATTRGEPVRAVDSGKVSYADRFMGYGLMVIIDHGSRFHTVYSRLAEIRTSPGRTIRAGETIGIAGDTLHFEFRVGARSVDPQEWLTPQ